MGQWTSVCKLGDSAHVYPTALMEKSSLIAGQARRLPGELPRHTGCATPVDTQ